MSLRLNGSTSGYSEIDAPAIAGDQTFTLPANGGLIQTVGRSLTLGTAQASTSGTAIDFNDIPSWVKRLTVMFDGVSTNGASIILIRLGSTSFAITGYNGTGMTMAASSTGGAVNTTGFAIGASSANFVLVYGSVSLENISDNTWVATGSLIRTDTAACLICGGTVALAGTLDRVRITTANGTDAFDAGSINILYEG